MAEKVTRMVLKVDLQCCRCYKKVKKVLCKFPQIRDQIYDEKANTVTITVVCCNPEKIRDKICCRGGGSIKSIEIKPPPKIQTKAGPSGKPEPKVGKPNGKDPIKPGQDEPEKPSGPQTSGGTKPSKPRKPKKSESPKEPLQKPPAPAPAPIPKLPESAPPPPMAYPLIGCCCTKCYHGHDGGPCYFGGGPPFSRPCCETYARPVYDSWGSSGYTYCYASRDDCFGEEKPQACSIM
ncbi:hypothetical protein DITRI_Ditri20bG0127200 [Diplodiscus trichospermus]